MAKLRLTKNESKKQKDALKRYQQYLPTLILKKQQLQAEIAKLHNELEDLKKKKAFAKANIYKWVDVFAEETGIDKIVSVERVEIHEGNIAGIEIPVFDDVVFKEEEYDLLETPLWMDFGVDAIKEMLIFNARMDVLQKQDALVKDELRVTTQRVNLFEKVMIPQAKENIRKIQIYLGDMQTAAVVTGKIAKDKIQKKKIKAEVI